MNFAGVIHIGSNIDVIFRADFSNDGPCSIISGWVPRGNTNPTTLFGQVVAGQAVTHSVEVSADFFQLRVTIDVPDPSGTGRLEVLEDGITIFDNVITADTTWAFPVA